jgi:hypothetical protein
VRTAAAVLLISPVKPVMTMKNEKRPEPNRAPDAVRGDREKVVRGPVSGSVQERNDEAGTAAGEESSRPASYLVLDPPPPPGR